MFDGTLNATIGDGDELDRLRAVYDSLLTGSPDQPGEEALAELAGMARIFDLDADRPPADVWRDLRAVLMRHEGPVARTGDPAALTRPLTVMVVEDDPGMASDLTELLAAAGHGVVGPFADTASADNSQSQDGFATGTLQTLAVRRHGVGEHGGGPARPGPRPAGHQSGR